MPDLRVTHLSKSFDGHAALRDLSLDADAGELVTLLGPSGCGKSTTLWSIGGLHRPDSGAIEIGGTTVFDSATGTYVPPEKRECGVVFQSYAIWPNMTVAENVGYPLKLRRVRGQARRDRVDEVLDLVELGGLAGRYPHQLSGGQQQRVALARALAHPPRLLLLDEPFSNLDAKLRERARVWLRALQREVGITTIFVTHDQDEALSLSDRIVVMSAGEVHQVGTPEEIYAEPADLFVADFVGTVNLLAATVASSGARTGGCVDVVVSGIGERWRAASAPDAPAQARDLDPGTAVTLAVRPEAIVVHHDGVADGRPNVVTAPVVDVSYLGDHYRYRVDVGGTAVTVQTGRRLAHDGALTIEMPPASLRAFLADARTTPTTEQTLQEPADG